MSDKLLNAVKDLASKYESYLKENSSVDLSDVDEVTRVMVKMELVNKRIFLEELSTILDWYS